VAEDGAPLEKEAENSHFRYAARLGLMVSSGLYGTALDPCSPVLRLRKIAPLAMGSPFPE